MFEFLVIAWVAWQFTNLLFQDGIHAIKGTTPPRHVERMERLRYGEQVPVRYGISGYLKDLLDDALRADVERRRRKREKSAEETLVPDPSTEVDPTGDGRPEDPVAATVPDPAAPVAATGPHPQEPPRSVVHTDDHSYCDADDCRTETDRHTADGPPCPLGCGGRIVSHRVNTRDNQTKDLLCNKCGWLVKKPATPPQTGAAQQPATSEPQTGVDEVATGAQPPGGGPYPNRPMGEDAKHHLEVELFGKNCDNLNCPHCFIDVPCTTCDNMIKARPWHNPPYRCMECAASGVEPDRQPVVPEQPGPERIASVIPFPVQPGADVGTSNEGASMPNTDTTNPSGVTEVTGIASAVAYAKGVAAAHAAHGDGEGYVGSLANFEVGSSDIDKVRAAQEASRNAAALWQAAADALHTHNMGVREAYASSPEAGNKQFATSE